jgi:cellulose synthase/poly-beta-1,6-N-acetylglucosamine synthase-like glycosyltransferase
LIFLVTGQFLMDFVFFYPLFMSGLWIAGGLYFWLHWERHWPWQDDTLPPPLEGEPLISILIPCYNEGENAADTIHAALAQHYPNIEVIAINDGSKDNTAEVLDRLARKTHACGCCIWRKTRARPWPCAWAPLPRAANIWCASTATRCWHRTRRPIWWRRCSTTRASAP